MNEYRTYQKLTADPALSTVYAHLADLHDSAAHQRQHRALASRTRKHPANLRERAARTLRRWAERLDRPAPRPVGACN